MPSHLPLPDSLLEDVQIDPKSPTGLSWKRKVARRTVVGEPCGTVNSQGYLQLGYKGRIYRANRVIYFLQTGVDPGNLLIDHIDGNRSNNSIENLRLVDKRTNGANSRGHIDRKCHYKGVTLLSTGRYEARCSQEGRKTSYIGRFDTEEEAAKAYDRVALAEYGEFAKLNFTASKS